MSSSAPVSPDPSPVRRRRHSPEAVARARALVEGTTLSQRAIARDAGVGARMLRGLAAREGWRRPPGAPRCREDMPALLDRMRALAEGTRLTQRAIARELRVGPGYVSHAIRRHRWVRPRPEGAVVGPVAMRSPKRAGRPFRIDVVVAVRDLYTGTTLSLSAIAARTGVNFCTVGQLGRRHGWARPEGAPLCPRTARSYRASLPARLREARGRVRALAERWAAAWEVAKAASPAAAPAGPSALASPPGPAAPAAIGRARRLAAAAGRSAP